MALRLVRRPSMAHTMPTTIPRITTHLPKPNRFCNQTARPINTAGGSAKLTIYPKNEHNAWSDTYSNPEVFRWLLSHRNVNTEPLTNAYRNAEIYG